MSEILSNLAKVLPQLLIIAALSGLIGWWLRGSPAKKAEPAKAAKPTGGDKQQPDRAKNLEAAMEKSKAANKALKAELESLKSNSIAKAVHDQQLAELEALQGTLAHESKRAAALEVDLKKAQEILKDLNSRANEVSKAQKDRSFALENELSKVRQELAILQNRPDDTATLQAEIDRLREAVATTTRFAGELRKREATALEALEKAQAQLSNAGESAQPARSASTRKIGPVGDSDRVSAAKAEVLRLLEQNKRRTLAAASEPLATPTVPVVFAATGAVAEESEVRESAPVEVVDAPVGPDVREEPIETTSGIGDAPSTDAPSAAAPTAEAVALAEDSAEDADESVAESPADHDPASQA
jgi:hypothetical protein